MIPIHYFTPSENDKDFCKRCGKYVTNTSVHVTEKTDPIIKLQAHFNGKILDLENVNVHDIDEKIPNK
jgi:hypothetical protein